MENMLDMFLAALAGNLLANLLWQKFFDDDRGD